MYCGRATQLREKRPACLEAEGDRAWEEPKHEEFSPRTAWSLVNAFTEVGRGGGAATAGGRKPQALRANLAGAAHRAADHVS